MDVPLKKKRTGKLHVSAVLTALLCFGYLMVLTVLYQLQLSREERLQMEYIAHTIESETYETLLLQIDKARVLEGYLIETGGTYDSFDPIGEALLKDSPDIQNVLFAPNGIVSKAYPAEGNEATIGLDLNSNGQGNLEAQAAIQAGELFLAGPFELVEGGMGICGRLPIYLENEEGVKEYWGLISVSLKYPGIFENHSIRRVNDQGFACCVWRINPDDGQKQVILETQQPVEAHMAAQQYPLTMFNANWVIELASLTPWYGRPMLWIMVLGSLVLSLLAAYGVASVQEIRRMRAAEAARKIQNLSRQLEWEQTNTLLHQISSHFFYHTLNALQALIVLKPEAAYKMAGDFSRYLRFNVDAITASGGVVSFKEELRAVRAYADINEQQLGGRLKVVFDVPDVDFQMPALTLQPIVENAILHGIKPKVGGGTVTIGLRSDDRSWYITVEDDGQGFDPSRTEQDRSIGIGNVRKRIGKFEGCSLEIASAPGCGTKAVLIYQKILKNKD